MKRKESGSTIVLSMIVIIVLAMCVACALDYTLQVFRDTEQTNARAQAITAATGALDLAFVQFREACRLAENQDLTTATITSGTAWSALTSYPSLTGTGASSGSYMNIPGLSSPIAVTLNALDATNPNAIANPLTSGSAIPTQAVSQTMPTWSYLAKATASFQSIEGTQTVNVCRVFQKITMSPWQYAVFYNGDLEINPGATMNINGSVQANGNMYTGGSDGTNFLNFSGPVNYAGTWNPNGAFDPDDTANAGETPVPPTGTKPTAGSTELPENSSLLGTASTTPGLQDGYHEIIEPPPAAPATDPLAGTATDPSERYYNQAGVKIMLTGASRTVSMYDAGGTLLTGGTTQTAIQQAIYKTFTAAITTTATLQDNRQGATVDLTTLDISKIEPALTSGGSLYGDGANIVYIDDETATSSAARGVELINGYQMPTGGLTVVSDNPVYIQGDYNTATSSADIANVPSDQNASNPLLPQAPDYTRQPCAVMADAVTLLSNAWTNSGSSKAMDNATNTTFNTAILSGIVTSGPGFVFSGGVENFPRLLENWSGNYLTIYGSMVQLFNSMQATAVYKEPGPYYDPPIRQWYFDINFYSFPPPGTFEVISYAKSRWFIE